MQLPVMKLVELSGSLVALVAIWWVLRRRRPLRSDFVACAWFAAGFAAMSVADLLGEAAGFALDVLE